MPIPSNPTFLKDVLGSAADKSTIPATTPLGSGAFSYQSAFPQITAVPLTAGGIAPAREDFNAAFNLLSQHVFFQQSGNVYRWNDTNNYLAGAHIISNTGVEYVALAASGPDVPDVGAKNPMAAENRGVYWATLSEVATKPATASRLGGIKVGDGFNVLSDGTLSVDPDSFSADLISQLMEQLRMPRWMTANRNFYVRPDGNDNNVGNANDAAHAFKTIQKAVDYVSENCNLMTYNAYVRVMAGTYNEDVNLPQYATSGGNISIIGESTSSTVLNGCIYASSRDLGYFSLENMTIRFADRTTPSSTVYSAVKATQGTTIYLVNVSVDLTTTEASFNKIALMSNGGTISIGENNILSGTCRFFLYSSSSGGVYTLRKDLVINGTANGGTIYLMGLAQFYTAPTANGGVNPVITGEVTGTRYNIRENSICNTGGGGTEYFPGTIAGDAKTGGQYI